MAGDQEAVQEEAVEAVKQDVDCLEASSPGACEPLLHPVSQRGHRSIGLEMQNIIILSSF